MGNKGSRKSLQVTADAKPGNRRVSSLRSSKTNRRMSVANPSDLEEVVDFLQPAQYAVAVEDLEYNVDSDSLLVSGDIFRTFKGTYGGKPVAVTVFVKAENAAILMKYGKECRVLANLGKHPNIINFIGVDPSTINQQILVTVFELIPYGCLLDFIKEKSNPKVDSNSGATAEETIPSPAQHIPLARLISWAMQIANAMVYVSEKGFVHRDLALRNVFLFEEDTVKIGKFDYAQRLGKDGLFLEENRNTVMPLRWMAVESLRNFSFTVKSDVWSYGITLWEMFTFGQQPYAEISSDEFTKALKDGTRLPKPDFSPDQIYTDIMSPSWKSDPLERPSFPEILKRLEEFKRDNIPESVLKSET